MAQQQYEVKTLSVTGNNKIYRLGEKVTQDNFPGEDIEVLAAKGFLKKVGPDVAPEKASEPDPDSIESDLAAAMAAATEAAEESKPETKAKSTTKKPSSRKKSPAKK